MLCVGGAGMQGSMRVIQEAERGRKKCEQDPYVVSVGKSELSR